MSRHSESNIKATRRQAIQSMGLAAFGCLSIEPIATAADNGEDALDEAYRILRSQEPQSQSGLSNHAPMVAEALCALAQHDKAVPWVRSHNAPILELPPARHKIDRNNWKAAVGPVPGAPNWEAANARWGDWKEYFTEELANARWQGVLNLWAGRLAPGMSGAATHGVIRTGHVVRALGRRNNAERRAELARALAYWASSYEELPARMHSVRGARNFTQALSEVPLYVKAFGHKPDGRNIVEALRHVKELDRFADVKDLVANPTDISAAISALTATFTRVYLRHGTSHDSIAFVHAVTGPCSLRRMTPFIEPEIARTAFPYAWQAAAAIYSAFGRSEDKPKGEEARLSPGEIAAKAVQNGDAHAIKFTEVMLAEHKINSDPVYLAAAEDAVSRL